MCFLFRCWYVICTADVGQMASDDGAGSAISDEVLSPVTEHSVTSGCESSTASTATMAATVQQPDRDMHCSASSHRQEEIAAPKAEKEDDEDVQRCISNPFTCFVCKRKLALVQ